MATKKTSARKPVQRNPKAKIMKDQTPQYRVMAHVRLEVQQIPERYLNCRAFGHPWKPYDVEQRPNDPNKRYVQELLCTRCDTLRAIFMDEDARIKGNAYFYPEGYVLEGIGRLTADENAYIRLRTMGVVL